MAFDPSKVEYPEPNLKHMFSRHKGDWGFKDKNWNNQTKVEFEDTIKKFIAVTPKVYAGTYRKGDAWLVVNLTTHQCAIVHRDASYAIWSGWILSDAQFVYATTPPYALGGGALTVFGDILESIIQTGSHNELDELTNKFFETYKAHGTERYDEASEKTLSNFFAALDNYIPPNMAAVISPQASHIHSLDEVTTRANRTLAVLEKNS
ncbi:uncharacterized protein NFIA_072140 [Aspergillus fischeri NRRL 181]|uniref:Colicin D C-terminal domain-containing protein n=1 Tax=Neosartorya fischeri (strain ATCC 1020 / DSM 3700 / CBS 544.65 / FGSC A1164 / JCM 1740 / NRRL 181 / WB 181) TaxID=331117 RepID=A1DD43_NEOFI|nr:uncharacterized protein NFIA_072140 [Aspergillus fischeri NRRL 181]EAW17300.1 hypothetical protein NFIA_072140 [Aspergillus fischeri NRRL 181]